MFNPWRCCPYIFSSQKINGLIFNETKQIIISQFNFLNKHLTSSTTQNVSYSIFEKTQLQRVYVQSAKIVQEFLMVYIMRMFLAWCIINCTYITFLFLILLFGVSSSKTRVEKKSDRQSGVRSQNNNKLKYLLLSIVFWNKTACQYAVYIYIIYIHVCGGAKTTTRTVIRKLWITHVDCGDGGWGRSGGSSTFGKSSLWGWQPSRRRSVNFPLSADPPSRMDIHPSKWFSSSKKLFRKERARAVFHSPRPSLAVIFAPANDSHVTNKKE